MLLRCVQGAEGDVPALGERRRSPNLLPDLSRECFATNDSTRITEQLNQQIKFPRCQIDNPPRSGQPANSKVDIQVR